jgi:hypothetical protein
VLFYLHNIEPFLNSLQKTILLYQFFYGSQKKWKAVCFLFCLRVFFVLPTVHHLVAVYINKDYIASLVKIKIKICANQCNLWLLFFVPLWLNLFIGLVYAGY